MHPVNAATGLKRLAIAVAAVVAGAFVTLIALSFLISATAVGDAVKAEIRDVTGLDPIAGADVSVSLFPSGMVRFRNVLLGDDRTGIGVHEGISCLACHEKHGQQTRASCANCHPRLSNCGLDVEKMDTTFFSTSSKHNIHWVKCADCHTKGVPAKKQEKQS